MHQDIDSLFRDLKKTTLTDTERASIRSRLLVFMREHPAKAPLYVRIIARWESHMRALSSPHIFQSSFRMRAFAAAFVVVVCTGFGSSYAAESALPGDLLYPMKTQVNERLMGSLAFSDTAKAQWAMTIATRRLEEVETLASEGRLSEVNPADVSKQFDTATTDFEENIAALATSTDTTAVADAQSDLEASLSAHADVLAALNSSLATSTQTELAPILSQVQAQVADTREARIAAEDKITSNSTSSLREAVISKKRDAVNALKTLSRHAKTSLQTALRIQSAGATTTIQSPIATSTQIATEESTIQNGDVKLQNGDYVKAYSDYQSVVRQSKENRVRDSLQRLFRIKSATKASGNASSSDASAQKGTDETDD